MTSHKMFGFCRAGEERWENGNKMGCIGINRGHLCHYFAKKRVKYDMMAKEKIEVISWEKKER